MNAPESVVRRLTTPLTAEDVQSVRCGDRVLLSGPLYTARDAAHKRMVEALERGDPLPFDPKGQAIYYVGPSPAPPGRPIGSAGPTTSYRMDAYAPALYRAGVKATIGKGPRSESVIDVIRECGALYLAAIGGAAALLARHVKEADVIAYPDLGTEAVRRLIVEDFPTICVNDTTGEDLYSRASSDTRG